MNPQRTTLFLMANLASEVFQVFSFKKRGEYSNARQSVERAGRILAQLKSYPEMESRKAELSTLEEVVNDSARAEPVFDISEEQMEAYFFPFTTRLLAQR